MYIIIRHTGTTPGHEYLHGEIQIGDKIYTYAGHTVRNGVQFLVHKTDIVCIGFGQMLTKIKKHYGRECNESKIIKK